MSKAVLEALLTVDELPRDVRIEDLVPVLEQAIASPDPHIRENLALVLFERWIHGGCFPVAQLLDLTERMIANLRAGLGEATGDNAFARAYSVLVLFEIVGYHNQKDLLSAETLRYIQKETINYLLAEKDERVIVPGKGWLHAVPDALNVLVETAKSKTLGRVDHENILDAVYNRARGSVTQVYTGFEDELFALTVVAVLHRSLVPADYFSAWVEKLVKPPEGSLSWLEHLRTPQPELILLANLKATLRALYLQIDFSDEPLPDRNTYLRGLRRGLETLDTGFYKASLAE